MFCHVGNSICCQKCFAEIPKQENFTNNILSIYRFSEPKINKLIWQFKYYHSGDIAKLFGDVLAENLLRKFSANLNINFILVPIPLNQSDKRLHNHAELLAREISLSLNIPQSRFARGPLQRGPSTQEHFSPNIFILNNILIKNSKQKQSHTKGRQERFENVKGAFSVDSNFLSPHPNPPPSGEGKVHSSIYIIVDDVTTSGATIAEARKTLAPFLHIPESEIYALTVAY